MKRSVKKANGANDGKDGQPGFAASGRPAFMRQGASFKVDEKLGWKDDGKPRTSSVSSKENNCAASSFYGGVSSGSCADLFAAVPPVQKETAMQSSSKQRERIVDKERKTKTRGKKRQREDDKVEEKEQDSSVTGEPQKKKTKNKHNDEAYEKESQGVVKKKSRESKAKQGDERSEAEPKKQKKQTKEEKEQERLQQEANSIHDANEVVNEVAALLKRGDIPDITGKFMDDFLSVKYRPSHLLSAIERLEGDDQDKATLSDSCTIAIQKVIKSVSQLLEARQKARALNSNGKVEENKNEGVPAGQALTADKSMTRLLWKMLPTVAERRKFTLATSYDVVVHAIDRMDVHCMQFLVSGSRVAESEYSANTTTNSGVNIAEYGNDPKIAKALLQTMASAFREAENHILEPEIKLKLSSICSWYTLFTPRTKSILEKEKQCYLQEQQEEGGELAEFVESILKSTESCVYPHNVRQRDGAVGSAATSHTSARSSNSSSVVQQIVKKVNFAAGTKPGSGEKKRENSITL
ncbi:MAG: hypothetical protein JSS50_03660 [Proteobacteria bacterium]|nr:hypothetical protein [Pseudomonadota bacterium]